LSENLRKKTGVKRKFYAASWIFSENLRDSRRNKKSVRSVHFSGFALALMCCLWWCDCICRMNISTMVLTSAMTNLITTWSVSA